MSLFPFIQPEITVSVEPLPMAREIAWDFERDLPVLKNGEPVFCEGAEAVAVWAFNALQTVRYRHEIFSWDYGCELETLIGQQYSAATKKAEAIRYVREALTVNPYITEVNDIRVEFDGKGLLTVSCRILTIYGEIKIERRRSDVREYHAGIH